MLIPHEIDNPLAHIEDLSLLDERAKDFALRVNPQAPEYALWIRAVRAARDPLSCNERSIPGLTPIEKRALNNETSKGFWAQPKTLRVTIITLCLGAIVQGFSQTGGNGANQSWPIQLKLQNPDGSWKNSRAIWIFSSVNAVTYLVASIFGCWLSDPLQSWLLGRRGAIFISGLLVLSGVIGAACSHTWQQLLACRAILGLGMGAKASVVPIMGAEVSPPHLRGALVMNWQLMDAFGIFLGFTSNLILAKIGPLSWRFQIAATSVPTICLLSLILTIPESPRFLLKKGRLAEAYKSLLLLRETPIQAARELYYANAQIQAEVSLLPSESMTSITERQPHLSGISEKAVPNAGSEKAILNTGSEKAVQNTNSDKHEPDTGPDPGPEAELEPGPEKCKTLRESIVMTWRMMSRHVDEDDLDSFQRRVKKTNYFTRFWQLFRDKRTRRATVAALVVMLGQQLCGINVLQFYSSTFFATENGNFDALWLSWGLGLANFVFTFPIYYFIDKRGRRFLLLATYPGMALSMLAACLSYNISESGDARRGVVVFFIFIFFFFYSWGQGPVAFAYSSEIFPLLNREQGMSFAVFINLLGAGLLTLFVPKLTTALQYGSADQGGGESRLLAVFAGLNVLSFLLIFFLVPETAGATLGKEAGSLNYISLEELNYIFGVSTVKHINYQLEHGLPWAGRWVKWWFSKYLLRRPVAKPREMETLYTWVGVKSLNAEKREADVIPTSNSLPEK